LKELNIENQHKEVLSHGDLVEVAYVCLGGEKGGFLVNVCPFENRVYFFLFLINSSCLRESITTDFMSLSLLIFFVIFYIGVRFGGTSGTQGVKR
jgi:hypothetical protein